MFEPIPKLLSHYFVWTIVGVFLFDVRLLGHAIEIFMHSFQQDREHLLAVVLGKALELDSLTRNPVFYFPRSDSVFRTIVHVIN